MNNDIKNMQTEFHAASIAHKIITDDLMEENGINDICVFLQCAMFYTDKDEKIIKKIDDNLQYYFMFLSHVANGYGYTLTEIDNNKPCLIFKNDTGNEIRYCQQQYRQKLNLNIDTEKVIGELEKIIGMDDWVLCEHVGKNGCIDCKIKASEIMCRYASLAELELEYEKRYNKKYVEFLL